MTLDSIPKLVPDTLYLAPHGGPIPQEAVYLMVGAVIVAAVIVGLAFYGLYSWLK
jgi:hypothetical protein